MFDGDLFLPRAFGKPGFSALIFTCAEIGSHYNNRIRKIRDASSRIGQATFAEHLQKQIEKRRMRFFKFVQKHDGKRLFATVGSNSNVGEKGVEAEINRASVLEIDLATGRTYLFASGLRNPNGLSWQPESGALWVAVNERDEIGSDLVPDYMTSVRRGGFYGWPYSYFGQHVDARVKPPRPDLVAKAIAPDYSLGAHVAALGLAHVKDGSLPPPLTDGMFIGQHGSWNRAVPAGYNVVFVPFEDGRPSGQPVEVLSGFVSPRGEAWGRPVGVALDARGALLVADDVGNVMWRAARN